MYPCKQGYSRIENLEEYTGVKVLWLEGNGLTAITGLEAQAELSTLYLQENALETIEGISHLAQLNTLNLSQVGFHKIWHILTPVDQSCVELQEYYGTVS